VYTTGIYRGQCVYKNRHISEFGANKSSFLQVGVYHLRRKKIIIARIFCTRRSPRTHTRNVLYTSRDVITRRAPCAFRTALRRCRLYVYYIIRSSHRVDARREAPGSPRVGIRIRIMGMRVRIILYRYV